MECSVGLSVLPIDGDHPPKLFLRTLGNRQVCQVAAFHHTERTAESTSFDPQKEVDGEGFPKLSPSFARSVRRDGVVPSAASPLQTRAVPLWCWPRFPQTPIKSRSLSPHGSLRSTGSRPAFKDDFRMRRLREPQNGVGTGPVLYRAIGKRRTANRLGNIWPPAEILSWPLLCSRYLLALRAQLLGFEQHHERFIPTSEALRKQLVDGTGRSGHRTSCFDHPVGGSLQKSWSISASIAPLVNRVESGGD